ncbi:hypothetical protein Rsub_04895 [Raphidocelis subcapitata]|uniref:Uncharacterized protein n=1 Tax=Raphidocelis subcapitata TaxID=307507 RepID=A0A2V0P1S6_9CHLO|nr:hypothetical protein Rsub_04895 [Raphidocelis subcapitata]|eukprot:GBF91790.1 hypothetical protein Rsub_04895 [Raphidocelis subcapitata]
MTPRAGDAAAAHAQMRPPVAPAGGGGASTSGAGQAWHSGGGGGGGGGGGQQPLPAPLWRLGSSASLSSFPPVASLAAYGSGGLGLPQPTTPRGAGAGGEPGTPAASPMRGGSGGGAGGLAATSPSGGGGGGGGGSPWFSPRSGGSSSRVHYSDRFIPSRAPHARLAFSPLDREVATAEVDAAAAEREDLNPAYNMLLRSELLGCQCPSPISPDKAAQLDQLRGTGSPGKRMLRFKCGDASSPVAGPPPQSPFQTAPLPSADALGAPVMSPRRPPRKIPRAPFKVLDAPALQDDFYLNLVDWSAQNVLAVTKLCDLSPSDSVCSVSWSQRGAYLSVGTNGGDVQIWDAAKLKRVRTMGGHKGRVGTQCWSSHLLSSGSRDRSILQRDVRAPEPYSAALNGHRSEVCGLKWSPDGRQLASGGNDNALLIWDAAASAAASSSPALRFAEHAAAVKAIAWSPHQHGLLASGGGTADRCIRFWNSATGAALSCVDTGSQVCNLAWSKNVNEIVSAHGYSQNQVVVWKYPSMTKLATLTGHTYRVLYLAVSPDGQTIVTGAGDETLRFWNVFPGSKGAGGGGAGGGGGGGGGDSSVSSLMRTMIRPRLRPRLACGSSGGGSGSGGRGNGGGGGAGGSGGAPDGGGDGWQRPARRAAAAAALGCCALAAAVTGADAALSSRLAPHDTAGWRVSVIVPTLNEAAGIEATVAALRALTPPPFEIIVADGGSTDSTPRLASRAGARVVRCRRRGRAAQMNAGAAAARGEVLAFVHADTQPVPDLVARLRGAFEDPKMVAAGFRTNIEVPGRRLHLMTAHNTAKTWYAPLLFRPLSFARGLRCLFGDQTICVRGEDFRRVGGFDERWRIMEDAQLCIDLHMLGPPWPPAAAHGARGASSSGGHAKTSHASSSSNSSSNSSSSNSSGGGGGGGEGAAGPAAALRGLAAAAFPGRPRGRVLFITDRPQSTSGRRLAAWGAARATAVHLAISLTWYVTGDTAGVERLYERLYTDSYR